MGLDSYDQSTPMGSTSLNQGDNKIRELAQKTCNSVEQEHTLAGKHKIPNGSLGNRPAAGNVGRLYIVNDPVSGNVYLQFDNGTSWVDVEISSESGFADDLDAHKSAATLDHPSGSVTSSKLADLSVTQGKIGLGALKKKHFDSGHADPSGDVSSLVDGTELDATWHTHPAGAGASGTTFLASVPTVASGSGSVGWTNLDLTADGVPDTAIGVIIQGNVVFEFDNAIPEDKTPRINVRKSAASDTIQLCGGAVVHAVTAGGIERLGFRGGPSIVPIGTGATLQYIVQDVNYSWEINLLGYIE